MGTAVGHQIGRHVHPAVKAETSPVPAPVTGIDYLGLVHDQHTAALTERVNYAGLTQPTGERLDAEGVAGVAGVDDALEAELASFAALSVATGHQGAHPDQLDLLIPTDPDHQAQEQS